MIRSEFSLILDILHKASHVATDDCVKSEGYESSSQKGCTEEANASEHEKTTRTTEEEVVQLVNNNSMLQTLRRKLFDDEEDYENNPWQFVRDVNSFILDNHKIFLKAEARTAFERKFDDAMKKLGYCCARVDGGSRADQDCMDCMNDCTIAPGDKYYVISKEGTSSVVCENCFCGASRNVRRNVNVRCKVNDHGEYKSASNKYVMCQQCKKELHQVCVRHMDEIWSDGFTCDNCHDEAGTQRAENTFTASNYPVSALSKLLESRVNALLAESPDETIGKVTIREVVCTDTFMRLRPLADRLSHYWGFDGSTGGRPRLPYRARVVFAFQEIDGVETSFFSMQVHEGGSNPGSINCRRAYIAYMDSVQYFQPRHLKTRVYQEIVSGYLSFAKGLGYTKVQLYSCPSLASGEYIFRGRPHTQKIPSEQQLKNWYSTIFEKAVHDGTVVKYSTMNLGTSERYQSPSSHGYFDGDWFPKTLEHVLEREFSVGNYAQQVAEGLLDYVERTKDDGNNLCFVVELYDGDWSQLDDIEAIRITYDDEHFAFHPLEFAQKHGIYFSTLRDNQFATMMLMYKCHKAHKFTRFTTLRRH